MAIYRFRVTFEEYDDVSRDIEIRAAHTFDDLHHAIHNAIGFDASKPASFYMSDDNWKKGREITNRDLTDEEKEKTSILKKARICDFIADPHQKIYYVFDPGSNWTFHIELIKIIPQEEALASYPRCTKSMGDAPKQYASMAAGVIPVPEDFDLESDLLDDDIEEEEESMGSEETLEVEESELPEGVETSPEFVAETDDAGSVDEFETADGDVDEESGPEADEF